MNLNTDYPKAEEEQYRLLVNCIKDYAIIMVDVEGKVMSWNKGAQHIKGYAAGDIIGQHINVFYTEEDVRNGEPARNLSLAREHGSHESLGWRLRKDGSLFWADVIFTAVHNKDGMITGFAKVTRDITERKDADTEIARLKYLRDKADKAINELNETLEIKVKERTRELETANKELEGFSYSVSHDLRSPLRAIHGYATMLQEDYSNLLDDEGRRMLCEVMGGATRMGDLMDDLLSFFRLGKQAIRLKTTDMDQVVKTVLREIRMAPDAHHAEINVLPLLPVSADPAMMLLVMTNLLSNAIKYSSKKEYPIINVASEKRDGETVYSVRDNGAGFEMAYAHKLFEVFQRLHSLEEFDGTGVGLAITQRIINKHRGRIWAEGEPGVGAIFYFSIPDSK